MITVLAIDGMHCEHCAERVQGALARVPGVESADVVWDAGRATVTHEGIPEMLVAAVEDEEFGAKEA